MKFNATRDDFKHTVKKLTEASHARYGDYAYSAGFYESMIADMLVELPKARRDAYLEMLQTTSKELKK
ncbi:hypothetical protein UFOVP116_245 [uncultured Caudovirales phage]|uniref:Uncharacterized protein n=1 Tax=uncultured Caudovirales phage TaxID=2100421 RepID=A0A6J5L6M2_9CAUD|nr:hypothetical protein UFOVP116_245 [uncultured Caudovirales phage]